MSTEIKGSLLAVDDSPETLDVITHLLSDQYIVRVATNGEKALKIATNLDMQPDLILLDIMMPGMDGYEVLKRLKNDPVTHDIPVIFLTAVAETEDVKRGLYLGVVDYITKPISSTMLKSMVKDNLMKATEQRVETAESIDGGKV